MEAERLSVLARVPARTAVAEAVVRGDLSLDDAADRFAVLNADNHVVLAAYRVWHPGATDGELVRRQVLQFVRTLRNQSPVEVAAAVARLEGEITSRFPPASPERRRSG